MIYSTLHPLCSSHISVQGEKGDSARETTIEQGEESEEFCNLISTQSEGIELGIRDFCRTPQ